MSPIVATVTHTLWVEALDETVVPSGARAAKRPAAGDLAVCQCFMVGGVARRTARRAPRVVATWFHHGGGGRASAAKSRSVGRLSV